jgi:hypothetical protein
MEELQAGIASLPVNANILWVLLTGFIVISMKAGFILVATVPARAKTMAQPMRLGHDDQDRLLYQPTGFESCRFTLQHGAVNLSDPFQLSVLRSPFA